MSNSHRYIQVKTRWALWVANTLESFHQLTIVSSTNIPCSQWYPLMKCMHCDRCISCMEEFVNALLVRNGACIGPLLPLFFFFLIEFEWLNRQFVCLSPKATLRSGCILYDLWPFERSRGIAGCRNPPVLFTMSCSHRSLTFLYWHIAVTTTPERLKT